MDYAQVKREKEARFEAYNEMYAEQLRLQGYIDSLEKDNEYIRDAAVTSTREKRRAKKLIKINDRDIKMHKRALGKMPPVPPFK